MAVRTTAIPGLLVVPLTVHGDARGWFKENWQRARMTQEGLPDFGPVQHSVAFNGTAGVTRGFHGEPWDKFVSVAHGQIFGAWVDLREGPTFGAVHTEVMDESVAVFVPQGVGNAYQTLRDGTVYSYLVNDHWSADASYTHVDLADPALGVPWPIPLDQAELSDKDRSHPPLSGVTPVAAVAPVVLGAGGQLGAALTAALPGARALRRQDLDLADLDAVRDFPWARGGVVVNAAAMTAVDVAETPEGRRQAWQVNATGVAELVRQAHAHRLTLVHYSSDYVFDGTGQETSEGAALAPLGVYGQSKAAGDLLVSTLPRHYLLRTSWVIGAGHNFVRTMQRLARQGVTPRVVADQVGRLTFTDDLAAATRHLLETSAAPGTYNVTAAGEPMSWADIARVVFTHEGRSPDDVMPISTQEYAQGQGSAPAPRPARSVLDLTRLREAGYAPRDQREQLTTYLEQSEERPA